MKAVIYAGKGSIKVENLPAPELQSDTDVIVRVKAASICGTDVRLYWGTMTDMFGYEAGDPMGHEFVGVVEDVGRAVQNFKPGQRVFPPQRETSELAIPRIATIFVARLHRLDVPRAPPAA